MRNGFFGFVAHVREAECFAPEFAVTWIDDEMMFFAQAQSEIENVDVFVVCDAGQGF